VEADGQHDSITNPTTIIGPDEPEPIAPLGAPIGVGSRLSAMQTRCKRTSRTATTPAGHAVTAEPLPARPDGTRRHLPSVTTQRLWTQEANKELR